MGAVNLSSEDMYKRYETTTNTNPFSSNIKSSENSTNNLVKDSIFYNDNDKLSKDEAFAQLNASSLFNQNKRTKLTQNEHDIKGLNKMLNQTRGKATMDANDDGILEEVDIASAIAASFDSELDLYIQEQVNAMVVKYGSSTVGKNSFLSQAAQAELREKGIVVSTVNMNGGLKGMVWQFSLVDEDGHVLQDSNGKKGSIIFADGLNADGYAEGSELELSSILDKMGYDCISKADFIGHEEDYYRVLEQVEASIKNGDYAAEKSIQDIYGEVQTVNNDNKSHGGGNGDEATLEALLKLMYNNKLAAAISKYKDEHDGKEPVGSDLEKLKNDVAKSMENLNTDEDVSEDDFKQLLKE